MNEINEINLSEQIKFWLSQIIRIEDYFQEINQRKSCSKKLSKYVAVLGCINKILIALSTTSSGVYFILSASVAGAPVGIANAKLTLLFFSNNRNTQIITEHNSKQNKKAW